MTVDCAMDPEDQLMLIENIKSEYLGRSYVCVPDFMNYSDADGMYSYENYVTHFIRQYGNKFRGSVILEFRQKDFKVEKAVYTEDENGLQFIVSYKNELTDIENEKVLFANRSQAVILFPDMTKLESCIHQISSWSRGGLSTSSKTTTSSSKAARSRTTTRTRDVKVESAESIYQKICLFIINRIIPKR